MIQEQGKQKADSPNNKKIFQVLFVITFVCVTALALMPSEKAFSFSAKDKVNHLIAYIVLSFLALLGFQTKRKTVSTIAVCFGLLCYGILIEWIQGFVGRQSSWWDVMANICGIIVGVVSATATIKRKTIK